MLQYHYGHSHTRRHLSERALWQLSIIALVFSLLLNSRGVQALECNLSGEGTLQLFDQVRGRIKVLESLEDNLQRLRQGIPTSLPPATLFVVALNDSEAVGKRIESLRLELGQNPQDALTKHPLYPCLIHSGDGSGPEKDTKTLQKLFALEANVSRLRLDFLSLSEERRNTLIELQTQAAQTQKQIQRLDLDTSAAEKTAQAAEVAKKQAESQAQEAATGSLRDLAAERAILEQHRKDLAELRIEMNQKLAKIKDTSKQQTDQLSKYAAVLSRLNVSQDDLVTAFGQVNLLWRHLADETLSFFTHHETFDIPSIPPFPTEILESLGSQKEANEYRIANDAASQEQKAFQISRSQFEEDTSGTQYRLLLSVGRIRAQYIHELAKRQDPHVFSLTNESFEDFLRELRLIPYRPLVLAQMGLIEGKELLNTGIAGALTLLNRLFLLAVFFVTPFLSYAFLRRLSQSLDQLRTWVLDPRHHIRSGPQIALWIQRINPFLPWIMMFLGALLASRVVKGTDLAAMGELVPYFYYFFIYKMFLILAQFCSVALSRRLPRSLPTKKNQGSSSKRLSSTARLIGRFLLISAFVIQATQSIARTGLVYHVVWNLLMVLLPLLLAAASYRWRFELGQAALELFPPKIGGPLSRWCQAKVTAIIASPATALAVAGSLACRRLYRNASQLESTKKISAQIFRRRLEAAVKDRPRLELATEAVARESMEVYSKYFDPGPPQHLDRLVVPKGLDLSKTYQMITNWSTGVPDEHSLIIQGTKGSGKSSVLQLIEARFPNTLVRRLAVPQKVLTRKDFRSLLGQTLSADLSLGESSLIHFDQQAVKTLILLDDCQNMFLAERGGFEAFHEFLSLIRADTKNIFWCAAFNRYSWSYLTAVTRSTGTFRSVLTLNQWSDEDIKSLILKRHDSSGYSLDFDPILFATESYLDDDQFAHVKDRFFQLLWEQSKGNPRTAIVLWLSSLGVLSKSNLSVGLPILHDSRQGEWFNDDELFVYASIIRHENLTVTEAHLTTNLPENLVRRAFAVGLDQEYLECDAEKRYRIRPIWQASLTQLLINKNFVYE